MPARFARLLAAIMLLSPFIAFGQVETEVVYIVQGDRSGTPGFDFSIRGIQSTIAGYFYQAGQCGNPSDPPVPVDPQNRVHEAVYEPPNGKAAVAMIQALHGGAVEPLERVILSDPATALSVYEQVRCLPNLNSYIDGFVLTPALNLAYDHFSDPLTVGTQRVLIIGMNSLPSDQALALNRCEDLRTMVPPVKICTIDLNMTITEDPEFSCPGGSMADFLKAMANTEDSVDYETAQPTGSYRCLVNPLIFEGPGSGQWHPHDYWLLCEECVCPDRGPLFDDCDCSWEDDQVEELPDCNGDEVADACDPDCNSNGISDVCEMLDCTELSCQDCDGDGRLNACEDDCDGDGIPDECEIADCASAPLEEQAECQDCNTNGLPDGCELPPLGCECGNGLIDSDVGECCDGPATGGATCADFGMLGEALVCNDQCQFDFSACQFPPSFDPHLVFVMGEEPRRFLIHAPCNGNWKVDFDEARLDLLFTSVSEDVIPGVEYTTPPLIVDWDEDCDLDLKDFQGFQNCFLWAAPTGGGLGIVYPEYCHIFTLDEDTDVDIDDYKMFAEGLGSPVYATAPVALYGKGLVESAALGDTLLTVLGKPPGAGDFQVDAVRPVTNVTVDVSPTTGRLGTEIITTISPAIPPLTFSCATAAQWTGKFDALIGPDSDTFTTFYSSYHVHESSAASAIILAGDGSTPFPPDLTDIQWPGLMAGAMAYNFGPISIDKSFGFTPTEPPAEFREIEYVSDSISTGSPYLGDVPSELPVIYYSTVPDPILVESGLLVTWWSHLAIVACIAENPTSLTYAPEFFSVDLVSLDAAGQEIAKCAVSLLRIAEDGDPSSIVYRSALEKPIILVDVDFNAALYPRVNLVQISSGGRLYLQQGLP